jgi:heme iron utilization protein
VTMNTSTENSDILRELCAGQTLAALATDAGASPYASLVAVAVTPDLRQLYFATPRATRKWANLTGNRRVALLMDNRSNQVTDFSRAAAATILGAAEELAGEERKAGLALYLDRHPHLAEFTDSPSCALFRVQIERIYLVTRFQNVTEFHFSP